MSGSRYLLDTNAIIALLQGDKQLLTLLNSANWIGVSVISKLEFLSFSGISIDDKKLFEKFARKIELIDLLSSEENLIARIIELRLKYKIKLPDAIIAASAYCNNSVLISKDKSFVKIKNLKVLSNWS